MPMSAQLELSRSVLALEIAARPREERRHHGYVERDLRLERDSHRYMESEERQRRERKAEWFRRVFLGNFGLI